MESGSPVCSTVEVELRDGEELRGGQASELDRHFPITPLFGQLRGYDGFEISRMPIEDTDVIDIISTDRTSGDVILTVSDHLDWSDTEAHQQLLQKKLNRYLAFVESGEILESYPAARGRAIIFHVVFKYTPDEGCRAFLLKVRSIIESAGIRLRESVSSGASFN